MACRRASSVVIGLAACMSSSQISNSDCKSPFHSRSNSSPPLVGFQAYLTLRDIDVVLMLTRIVMGKVFYNILEFLTAPTRHMNQFANSRSSASLLIGNRLISFLYGNSSSPEDPLVGKSIIETMQEHWLSEIHGPLQFFMINVTSHVFHEFTY